MTFNDTEDYSLRSIAILGFNIYSQITVTHVTLQKAVLSTVDIFAVYASHSFDFQSLLNVFPKNFRVREIHTRLLAY